MDPNHFTCVGITTSLLHYVQIPRPRASTITSKSRQSLLYLADNTLGTSCGASSVPACGCIFICIILPQSRFAATQDIYGLSTNVYGACCCWCWERICKKSWKGDMHTHESEEVDTLAFFMNNNHLVYVKRIIAWPCFRAQWLWVEAHPGPYDSHQPIW